MRAPALTSGTTSSITRGDGVRLGYDVHAAGDTDVMLLPAWAISDRADMSAQNTDLTATGTANPVRGRLNAALFRSVDWLVHRLTGDRKRALFAGLPAVLVEIGPGTGANFRYYRPGTRVVALEPNPHMHGPLASAARRYGIELDLRTAPAEHTGLPDGVTAAVVSTLVLCTVPDQAAALREIRRVLRPGGRLLFVEHVRARPGSPLAAVQRAVARPWRWFFEGCDVGRDTAGALRAAGFSQIRLERYRLHSPFIPVNEQIVGAAVR
jgi:SAM-dependent methyltransferase